MAEREPDAESQQEPRADREGDEEAGHGEAGRSPT
jgi:hypothetical protein